MGRDLRSGAASRAGRQQVSAPEGIARRALSGYEEAIDCVEVSVQLIESMDEMLSVLGHPPNTDEGEPIADGRSFVRKARAHLADLSEQLEGVE